MKQLLICILLLPSILYGQKKEAARLEQFLSGQRYSKVLKKASKHSKRYPGDPVFYLIQAKAHLALSLDTANADQISHEQALIRTYSNAIAKDKNCIISSNETVFTKNLKDYIRNRSAHYNKLGQSRKAREYTAFSARYLKDTTELYAIFFPVKKDSGKQPGTNNLASQNDVQQWMLENNFRKPTLLPNRQAIISHATTYLGVPYKWGGESDQGLDCSGFVLTVMRKFGYDFNHNARDISRLGNEKSRSDLEPGDLVFFGKRYENGRCKIDHIALVTSNTNGQIGLIHAVSRGVCQENLDQSYWVKKLLFCKDIIGAATLTTRQ